MKTKTFLIVLLCAPFSLIAQKFSCLELIEAVASNDYTTAKQLLEKTNPDCTVAMEGSPLIIAARIGNEQMVQLLLDQDLDVNLGVKGDGNPLIMAGKKGHLSIAKLLLEKGADVNYKIIGDETPLISAAWNGHLDMVKYLVAEGADVNLSCRSGYTINSELRTPLLMARRGKHKAVVDYLISQGAVK